MKIENNESSQVSSLLTAETASRTATLPSATILPAIATVSFAALLLELALTRLYSVVLFYHFAFLAISVALLGLGAGGVFAYVRRSWLLQWDARSLGRALCAGSAIAIVLALEVVLHVPVSLDLGRGNFLKLTTLYMASAVPFFLTGILFSVTFARQPARIPSLYGADLIGGATACLAIVPLLNFVGAPNAILVASFAMAIASALWSPPGRRQLAFALAAALLLIIAANYNGRLIDIVYAKGMLRDRSRVLFARWNAISRVEVDQQGAAKVIVIDADASSHIMSVDPHAWRGTVWEKDLMAAAPAVTNVLRPRGAYAIIGPGGGVDVLRAVANGSRNVTGIEINPIIATIIMRERYAGYAYHLYQLPEFRMQVSDGRSFIRGSHQIFDVVQMTLVDTWASTAAGAFALSENNLYTVEAFREYLDHLSPDGMLSITRWEFRHPREALRVVSVAIAALRANGAADLRRHFIVISDGPLDEDGRPVTVLAKKSAFTSAEEAAVRAHLAANPNLVVLYMPSAPAANAFSDLITAADPRAFAAAYDYNVTPVTDNAPFFFFTLKTLPALRAAISGNMGVRGMDWRSNLGVLVLGMVLAISFAAVAVFLLLPLAIHYGARGQRPASLFYFVAIGLGYIAVEIALIQRFVLFLGHPTYALTVVVFLLLLSSGAGSLLSQMNRLPVAAFNSEQLSPLRNAKQSPLPGFRISLFPAIIALALLLYIFALPRLLTSLVGLPFPAKLLLSALLLVPLGLLMGFPFPTGLRALAANSTGNENALEWAWALNAGSSVLGSVLAVVIAIHLGVSAAMAVAALAYLAVALLAADFSAFPSPNHARPHD